MYIAHPRTYKYTYFFTMRLFLLTIYILSNELEIVYFLSPIILLGLWIEMGVIIVHFFKICN